MKLLRLLLPEGDIRRWHLRLREKLQQAGFAVEIDLAPGASPPPALRLCEELERLIYGERGGDVCERAEAVAGVSDRPAILIDLTGADQPRDGAITLLYDGAPGDAARDAALLDGRAPRIAFARIASGQLQIIADGLPALERPWMLSAGRVAVAQRILALAPMALKNAIGGAGVHVRVEASRRNPLAFVAGALLSRARARLARMIAHPDHWRIGWRRLNADGGVMARQAWGRGDWTWLADDRQRYFADPFPFAHEGRLYLFCEEYPYATRKGVISVAAIDEAGRAETPRVVLEADCHLSYPLVFEQGGEIWMMPESSGGRRLDLYRAERFPDRWVRERTLVDGLEISDATPFPAQGRWWMTANVSEEGGSSWDCLSLFTAPDRLGPWTRCGDGPVLVDASCARPAGHVQTIGGGLWRPAQDCVGGYGAGLALCRIDHVGEDGFRQTVTQRLRPPPGAPADGAHTLNIGGGYEFIDAVGRPAKGAV